MVISKGLKFAIVALAITNTFATPIKRSGAKSSRQIEFTTSSKVLEQRTGYPEAGFRPKIPFILPNENPENNTEIVKILTSNPAASGLEDFDIVKLDEDNHIPADTYDAPLPPTDDAVEIEAEVVPAPAEDFQPPSEDAFQDFLYNFDFTDRNAAGVIADLPSFEQAAEMERLNFINNQLPTNTYGAAKVELNKPMTDVEIVNLEDPKSEIDEYEDNSTEGHQLQDGFNIESGEEEGSAESGLGLASDSETHKPADSYGAPRSEVDNNNEVQSELVEVGQQLEILSRLTRTNTGRLVLLPLNKNVYLGRLVSSPQRPAQRKSVRLLKL